MKSKIDRFPNFKDKCLSISLIDDDFSHDLKNPFFEYQGNKLFIVGTIPKYATNSNWSQGKKSAILWDRVKEYIVFDSLEEYKKATKISEKYKEDK